MVVRGILALVALSALAAFAPAPFPRTSRQGSVPDEISITTFQGKWRVASMKKISADGNHLPHVATFSHVTVKGDDWAFQYPNGRPDTVFEITIDHAMRPAHLAFWPHRVRPRGKSLTEGIIRKKGDVVEIIYSFASKGPADSFERPPEGQFWMTLQRIG